MKNLNRIFVIMIAFLFSFGMYSSNIAEANANIELTITSANISKGECICSGYFENIGDSTGVVIQTFLDVTFRDSDNNIIWTGDRYFGQAQYYLEPGEQVDWQFFMYYDDIPEYYGEYNWQTAYQLWVEDI